MYLVQNVYCRPYRFQDDRMEITMLHRLSRIIAKLRPPAQEQHTSEFNAGRAADHGPTTPVAIPKAPQRDLRRNVHDIEQLAQAGGWNDIAKSLRTSDRSQRHDGLSIA
jgi:hypothetical protein